MTTTRIKSKVLNCFKACMRNFQNYVEVCISILFKKLLYGIRFLSRPKLWFSKQYNIILSNAMYTPWLVEPNFKSIRKIVAPYSLLDEMRLYELWQLSSQVADCSGDLIEVGCWRGGAGCLVASNIKRLSGSGTVFLCDTFQGVVKAGLRDSVYRGGEHSDAHLSMASHLVETLSLTNVQILVGIFPDETASHLVNHTFKFVHIDVDVYAGARASFDCLFPRLIVGGIIVFDDYGTWATSGIRAFIDELQEQKRDDLIIVRNLNGQAVVIKI